MLIGSLPGTSRGRHPFALRRESRVFADLDSFRTLRQEWDKLALSADDISFCVTYPYCELAAELALAKGAEIAVAMVYDGRELRALWPLTIYRKGVLRIAKPLSCGSDEEYGAPLVHARADRAIYAALLDAAMDVCADTLEIRFVTNDSALHEAIRPLKRSWLLAVIPERLNDLPGYSINMGAFERWDDFTATLSKSLRTDLRCHLKRLNAKGRPELGWCTTADDAEAVLTWLFATKRRWAVSRGVTTRYLMHEQVRDFFIALARRTDLSTTPLVTFLKLDGRPIAASVNLVGPHTFEGFIMTYDEALSSCSPGNLLQEFCVKWAHANERDFDFRPLYAPYKVRWANRETRHHTHTLFLTTRGRLAEFSFLAGYLTRALRSLRKALAGGGRAAAAFVNRARRQKATSGPRTLP